MQYWHYTFSYLIVKTLFYYHGDSMRKCLFQHCTGNEAGPVVDLGAEHLPVREKKKKETNKSKKYENVRNTLMCRVPLFFLMIYKALILYCINRECICSSISFRCSFLSYKNPLYVFFFTCGLLFKKFISHYDSLVVNILFRHLKDYFNALLYEDK